MNYRDNEGNLPVHLSCLKSTITTLKFLIPFSAMNEKNIEGNTPLHIACLENNETLVFHLLKSRVSYKIQNKNGLTPGQIALISGNKNIILLFFVLDDQSLFDIKRLQQFFQLRIQEKAESFNEIR
jgi:ankyrin repeat protein